MTASRMTGHTTKNGIAYIYDKRNRKSFSEYLLMMKDYYEESLNITSNLPNNLIICYNKWFENIEYRKLIAGRLNLEFSDSGLQSVITIGRGSSFDKTKYNGNAQRMKVLNRWYTIRNTQEFKLLKKDKYLNKISNQLFGKIV